MLFDVSLVSVTGPAKRHQQGDQWSGADLTAYPEAPYDSLVLD